MSVVAEKRNERKRSSLSLGLVALVVERSHSWLNRSRRLLVRWEKKVENYLAFLHLASATTVFSEYVLPAWTNLSLIHLDPVIADWKQIYLSALSPDMSGSIQALVADYYQSLDALDIATIGAHELTHHLHRFSDTPEQAAWFEEGSCFYAPRKHLLPGARRSQLQQVERALIEAHEARLGGHPVWQFGFGNTGGEFTDALFDYWRAIQTVSHLGETYAHGDVKHLLTLFDQWKSQHEQTRCLFH
jgi:hypothetical protein